MLVLLFDLLSDTEDGGSKFPRNVTGLLKDYKHNIPYDSNLSGHSFEILECNNHTTSTLTDVTSRYGVVTATLAKGVCGFVSATLTFLSIPLRVLRFTCLRKACSIPDNTLETNDALLAIHYSHFSQAATNYAC
jgi:hypothetical protein